MLGKDLAPPFGQILRLQLSFSGCVLDYLEANCSFFGNRLPRTLYLNKSNRDELFGKKRRRVLFGQRTDTLQILTCSETSLQLVVMSHNFVCLCNLRLFYVTPHFMPVEHIVNCRWFFVEKFPKTGLLGRILWSFGEAHPTGDSWNDAMRHWPEEFIWKIELLMIVENPTRNLSRKSSTTFVGLAKKAARESSWSLVFGDKLLNLGFGSAFTRTHTVLASSVKVSGVTTYLQVLTSRH